MLFVDNRGITDARVNLALEEYVFRHKPTEDDVLLFYVNAPAIIIGRNQNTIEEINPDVVEARGIRVVRRVSGGGAVYHDLGNLNFSVMTAQVSGRFNRYDHFTQPVTDVLRELGVPAELSGRNDILAGGRKISGNAFRPHQDMPGLTAEHFARWVAAMEATVDGRAAGPHADRMKGLAHRIAYSMQLRLGITPFADFQPGAD